MPEKLRVRGRPGVKREFYPTTPPPPSKVKKKKKKKVSK